MSWSKTIRSLSALLLLFAFTLAITPKLYLHEIFAGHTDTPAENSYDGRKYISKSGFQCDVNLLVATSPFTDCEDQIEIIFPVEYHSFNSSLPALVLTKTYTCIESRGPPAVG